MWLRCALVSSALVAAAALSCDTHVRAPVQMGITNPTLRTMHLHADKGFKFSERVWISEATTRIHQQSAGVLEVLVDYDLDFSSVSSLVSHAGDDLLIRAPEDAPFVLYEDTDGGKLLGVVADVDLVNYSYTSPKQVFLVADRFRTGDVFVHVAMHEMLHAFGLRHTSDEDGVMFPHVTSDHPSLCIGEEDAVELCRVSWCRPETLNFCR